MHMYRTFKYKADSTHLQHLWARTQCCLMIVQNWIMLPYQGLKWVSKCLWRSHYPPNVRNFLFPVLIPIVLLCLKPIPHRRTEIEFLGLEEYCRGEKVVLATLRRTSAKKRVIKFKRFKWLLKFVFNIFRAEVLLYHIILTTYLKFRQYK